ncbi:MAG: alpha/beta hydrolase [Verrucomicrobiales bacterium]
MLSEIRNKAGERIDYTYHHGASGAQQMVVIGHGVTGNKDRPFLVALAEAISKMGVPTVRISFAGNGASGGKFPDCTISKEVDDLGSVLDVIKDRKVCYIGHSMGGAVGVMRTAMDKRINYLVSLAGMVHTKAFAEREFGMVKPGEGFMWDDTNCPLSQKYMENMAQIDSVVGKASQINIPWLLVHGSADDVVPIQDSYDIFANANQPKELVELPGANHVFSGEFTAPMIQTVTHWLKRQFQSAK